MGIEPTISVWEETLHTLDHAAITVSKYLHEK